MVVNLIFGWQDYEKFIYLVTYNDTDYENEKNVKSSSVGKENICNTINNKIKNKKE